MRIIMILIGLLCVSAMQAADPLVKEGKIWYYDYISLDNTGKSVREPSGCWRFENPTEKNGNVYYNFVKIGSQYDSDVFMRQDGDKVYMLLTNEDLYGYPDEFLSETEGEILLYDFSLTEGESIDSYYVYVEDQVFIEMPDCMTVISTETMTVNGVERRGQCLDLYFREYDGTTVYTFRGNQVIEGIGCKSGFITRPFNVNVMAHYEPGGYELSKVCDGDVEIFNHTDFDRYFTGIEEVSDGGGVKDGKMYDIMGREVKNPQPGSVYIQNGRKFVAR